VYIELNGTKDLEVTEPLTEALRFQNWFHDSSEGLLATDPSTAR
jgi:hypothetical protein